MKISDRIQLMALKWDSTKTEAKEKVFNIEAMKEWWQSVKRPSDQRHR